MASYTSSSDDQSDTEMDAGFSGSGKKRKEMSPASPGLADSAMRKAWRKVMEAAEDVAYEARMVDAELPTPLLIHVVERLIDQVKKVASTPGETSETRPKKQKNQEAVDTSRAVTNVAIKEMVDSSTETPIWWAFGAPPLQEEEPAGQAPRARRKKRDNKESRETARDVPQSDGAEGKEESWTTVQNRRRPESRPAERKKNMQAAANRTSVKPPAVLVKVAPNSTYAETVRTLRGTAGLHPSEFGASVRSMRQTRDGHLLVELGKDAKSGAAAGKLGAAIKEKLGDRVGAVAQLGQLAEIEIVDIDAAATGDEVLEALRAAIPEGSSGADNIAEREAVRLTGLWGTRSGQQVATLMVARATAARISKVTVGWTICRVRDRRPTPDRCHRCHGFGHRSRDCSGPDLSAACRRCGANGHQEKACNAGDDRCVACEREGLARTAHRTGSGSCSAWREANKRLRTKDRAPPIGISEREAAPVVK